jgi:hypothetical protein
MEYKHSEGLGEQFHKGSGERANGGRIAFLVGCCRFVSSPPEREVGWHTERDVGSYRSVLAPRIPGSDRRSCSRFCGRFQTPCTVPPQTVAFHPSPNTPSTASLPPKKGQSVTYVSGTICYLCLGSLMHNRRIYASHLDGLWTSR